MAGWFDLFNWVRRPSKPERTETPAEAQVPVPVDPELAGLAPEERDEFAHYLIENDWIHLSSTNVEAVRYNWPDHTLDVEFQTARYYTYFDVPVKFFLDFIKTNSPGGFVWAEIRIPDRFEYERHTFLGPGTRPEGGRNITVEDQ